jgi:single-stranded-DNA-specific exonuclease
MPLIGINRSLVKYGLEALNETKRPGLKSLFRQARIEKVGTYEVNYMIAPRINAMGRLEHGLESLRLLCTRDAKKAEDLAQHLGRVNIKRQGIVEEVISHARLKVTNQSVIVLASESYHEGVIGLAAGKLVEEFYRPAIVISSKGKISKASARSISGFNIIEAIRKLEGLYLEGGGHPMAAGFSIETTKIAEFSKKINEMSKKLLTEEILSKKLRIDLEIGFEDVTKKLHQELTAFNPTGLGNPTPTFLTKRVELVEARTVGAGEKHLKFKLKQNEQIFGAIFFGGGEIYSKISPNIQVDVVYAVEDNTWNGSTNLQLRVRDIMFS